MALALALSVAAPLGAQLAEQARPPIGTPLGSPVPAAGGDSVRGGVLPLESSFATAQLQHDRVMAARMEARFAIKRLFRERGLRYPAERIYLRIFKRERVLELWVQPMDADRFALLRSYDICALAGTLGPKRRQGDNQVPEGFYSIDWFNPRSDYLLSLHLDYPNRSDQLLGEAGNLGGDIFIHGGCNSEGCLAVTDESIQELYWLAVEARGVGQERIPVHIFPARLTDADLPTLSRAFGGNRPLVDLWQSMKPGYDFFERERRVPSMAVTGSGYYRLAGEDTGAPASPARPAPLGQPLGKPVAQPAPTSAPPPTR